MLFWYLIVLILFEDGACEDASGINSGMNQSDHCEINNANRSQHYVTSHTARRRRLSRCQVAAAEM